DANEIRTVILEVERLPSSDPPDLESPLVAGVQPSAYWLEDLGEGVTGNGVVAIAPDARIVSLPANPGSARATVVRVVNNHRDRALRFTLEAQAPAGLRAELGERSVEIPPSGFREIPLRLERDGAPSSAIAEPVQILAHTESGTVADWVWIDPAADMATSPVLVRGPIRVEIPDRLVRGHGIARARIYNEGTGPISGTAEWILPPALWEAIPRHAWRRPITIDAGDSVEVALRLATDLDSYAMLRFAYAGRVLYGETVGIVSDPQRIFLRADAGRLRIHEGTSATLRLSAFSLAGLSSDSEIRIAAPEGWQVPIIRHDWRPGLDTSTLNVDFRVTPPPGATDAELVFGDERLRMPVHVAPTQPALPTATHVTIDGDLSEWYETEFTRAVSDLGTVRTAVRYGPPGLAVAMIVEDDKFYQPYDGAAIWQGDSVQLGISVAPSQALGYDATDLEFGIAKTDQGDLVWCWYDGERGLTGRVEGAQAAVRVEPGRTVYELLLPSSALPAVALRPESVLGFCYIANDNDGDGFRGAVQWTRGMSGGKDSSLFGDLLLLATQ
ncbi:MAG: hypothetical protein KC729_12055, partial [Candidatus Eisenbacteria bacterium]|nr:hypothetical protein [Candidatus Eisenbacteria bacterium]